jgi:hypothetical protein
VLGVSSAHVFRSWGKRQSVAGKAEDIARARHSSDWKRLSAGAGTKGPRLHGWCYLELADLEVEKAGIATDGLWTRGLLIRRHIADGDLAFFTTCCPTGTSVETLVAVEGHRWAIEDSFETAKNEFGLDHNESRSWHGWHRHVSMVMLAFAMMAAIRHHANPPPPKKTKRRTTAKIKTHPRPHSAASLSDSLENGSNPTYHRMVILAQGTPGCRPARPHQKTATVMLVRGLTPSPSSGASSALSPILKAEKAKLWKRKRSERGAAESSYLGERFFAFGGMHGLTTSSSSSTASSFITVLRAGLNSPLSDR